MTFKDLYDNQANITDEPQGRIILILRALVDNLRLYAIDDKEVLLGKLEEIFLMDWNENLALWLEYVHSIRPYCILDPHPDAFSDLKHLSIEEAETLKELYHNLPAVWVETFDNIVWYAFESIHGAKDEALITFQNVIERISIEYEQPKGDNANDPLLTSYIRFSMPESVIEKAEPGFVENLFVRFWSKIIPKANPDFDDNIDLVSEWLVEFDNKGIPNREVGLDAMGKAIVKMPWKDNYGYWVDNNLTEQDFHKTFDVIKVEKVRFESYWSSLE